ncbi:MAG: hypothetical protein NW237_03035 [Cyanobacteriota bacterium]|nr:hypothetical protein [Cyanobacteriota bacterium]
MPKIDDPANSQTRYSSRLHRQTRVVLPPLKRAEVDPHWDPFARPLVARMGDPVVEVKATVIPAAVPAARPSIPPPYGRPSIRRRRCQTLCLETVTMIGVNIVLMVGAVHGLSRLLPVQLAQHNRLQLLEEQVSVMNSRVSRLQETLDRSMDPLQQEALTKEKFNLVPPTHIQVRLVTPPTTIAEESPEKAENLLGQVLGTASPPP